ncbi:cobalamin-dependent protein [bacterium]|nr:cobalamin-dependent protein [bacterium]
MELLLINPPRTTKYFAQLPPAGLAYIASHVRANRVDVDIIDAANLHIDHAETLRRATDARPDLIGITVVSGTHESASKLGEALKSRMPDTKIVLGGPHVHFLYQEMMNANDWIDFCVRGEGEHTMLELLQALKHGSDLSQIQGLVFRRGNELVVNPDRPFIKDLDSLPFPARDLLPMRNYRWNLFGLTRADDIPVTITATRGCPFHCHFCASSYLWNVQRLRSVQNVLDEIEECLSQYDVNVILFPDDLLLLREEWAIELCKGMIERGFDQYIWACTGRPGAISPKTLDWLQKAKCRLIMYGIEFGDQRLLDFSGKKISIAEIEKAIAETRKRGILTKGFFMLGYPTETSETIEATIRLAKRLKLDFVDFNLPKALPGSPLYDYCLQRDIIIDMSDENYNDVTMQMIELENINPNELSRLYTRALKSTRYSLSNRLRKFKRRLLMH